MALTKASDFVGGGGFFNVKEHMGDLALLIEPKSIRKNVPNEYNGQTSVRDELKADVSVFANQADLDAKKPSQVLKGVTFVHVLLTRDLEPLIGGGTVVTLDKTQKGSYCMRPPAADAEAAAEAYYEAREAAAQAFDDSEFDD
jgi:hypothetical protein